MAPRGYDVDMANLIAEKMGVKVELVPVTSANRIPYLQTKKVDLVISSLGKNPDREKVIDFSAAYAPFFNGVFGPKDVAVAKVEDLSGKTIGVTRGSVEDLKLTKIAPKDATIKRYEDNNGTISAFLSGQVRAVATGNVVAAAILARNPPKRPEIKFLIKNSPCYVGLNKDEPKLLDEGQRHHRGGRARTARSTRSRRSGWVRTCRRIFEAGDGARSLPLVPAKAGTQSPRTAIPAFAGMSGEITA